MKIAFIVGQFPLLSETFILNQITGLIDRGYEVDIYARQPAHQSTVHSDIEKYGLLSRTRYYATGPNAMPNNIGLRFVKAIWIILRYFHRNPLYLLKTLNVFRFGSQAASLRNLYRVAPFLDKEMDKYDIVHCHFGTKGELGVLLKDVGLIEGKVLTVFHGSDISQRIKRKGEHVYDYLFQNGDLFLPVSNRWKSELIRLGCPEEKILVHRMGIDTQKFLFHPRQPGQKVQLLSVARLVEKKGIKYSIQAVATVLSRYPLLEYKIVGDGPLMNDLQNLIDDLNINNRVKLLGWRRQEKVVTYMQEADILLAPSVTSHKGDQEGIPIVLMEALAQGVPVLSTLHSGISEVVQDGENGFLVPEGDIAALAEKLVYLIEHPEIRLQMGQTGRHYVEQHYDIHILNDQLVELYERLMLEKSKPAEYLIPSQPLN